MGNESRYIDEIWEGKGCDTKDWKKGAGNGGIGKGAGNVVKKGGGKMGSEK